MTNKRCSQCISWCELEPKEKPARGVCCYMKSKLPLWCRKASEMGNDHVKGSDTGCGCWEENAFLKSTTTVEFCR